MEGGSKTKQTIFRCVANGRIQSIKTQKFENTTHGQNFMVEMRLCSDPSHLNPPTLSNSCCFSILQKLAPTSLTCIWKDPWHFPIQRSVHLTQKMAYASLNGKMPRIFPNTRQ